MSLIKNEWIVIGIYGGLKLIYEVLVEKKLRSDNVWIEPKVVYLPLSRKNFWIGIRHRIRPIFETSPTTIANKLEANVSTMHTADKNIWTFLRHFEEQEILVRNFQKWWEMVLSWRWECPRRLVVLASNRGTVAGCRLWRQTYQINNGDPCQEPEGNFLQLVQD